MALAIFERQPLQKTFMNVGTCAVPADNFPMLVLFGMAAADDPPVVAFAIPQSIFSFVAFSTETGASPLGEDIFPIVGVV